LQIVNERIISQRKGLYYAVDLWKNNKGKTFNVHRLVAETFIDNPNNYKYINHIDGNKLNNNVSNLEFCTQCHNMKEAYRIGLMKPHKHTEETKKKISQSRKGISSGNERKVICLETGVEYESIKMASEKTNIDKSKICICCKGQRKTAGRL